MFTTTNLCVRFKAYSASSLAVLTVSSSYTTYTICDVRPAPTLNAGVTIPASTPLMLQPTGTT